MKNWPAGKKIFIFVLLVAVDQLTKFIILEGKFSAPFFKTICNKNIAWSISVQPLVFFSLWSGVIIFLAYFWARSQRSLEKIMLTAVLAGAFSNLLDRILRGCVVDFIDLRVWPVFNLADICITVGIILYLAITLKSLDIKR